MTEAVLFTPVHRRERVQRLAYVRENDEHKTSGAEQLQQGSRCLTFAENDCSAGEEHDYRDKCEQRFDERGVHDARAVGARLLGKRSRAARNPLSAMIVKTAPAANVPADPTTSQSTPATTLASRAAIPLARLKKPKAVPRSSMGEASTTSVAKSPCVRPMWSPRSTTPSATAHVPCATASATSAA